METYTVELRDGCTILRGSVPVKHFAALAEAGSKDDVIDVVLAQRLGANFVFGHPTDIEALRRRSPSHRLHVGLRLRHLRGLQQASVVRRAMRCSTPFYKLQWRSALAVIGARTRTMQRIFRVVGRWWP